MLESYEIMGVLNTLTAALESALSPDNDTPGVLTKREIWDVIQATAIDFIQELAD